MSPAQNALISLLSLVKGVNGAQIDPAAVSNGGGGGGGGGDEDENAPLNMSWPDSWRERITYVIILPIILPLWITLPDTRKPSGLVKRQIREASS